MIYRLFCNHLTICLIVFTGLSFAFPDSSFAKILDGVKYTEEIAYRDIYGKTASELVTQMKALNNERNSKNGFRWAKPDFNWRYNYHQAPGRCAIKSAHVTLHVTLTLPRWVNKATSDKALQRRWEKFLDNIKFYERGYAEIYRDAAYDIYNELKKTDAGTCKVIGKEANQRARAILDDLSPQYKSFHEKAKRRKKYLLDYRLLTAE